MSERRDQRCDLLQPAEAVWRNGPVTVVGDEEPGDRIAVLADRKVLATGTLEDMLEVDDPWVQEYFHGPRARAAFKPPAQDAVSGDGS